jgi:hypothetical protein
LGLDSAQRTRANTKLTSAIRRSTIDIDQTFRDYGRDVPSKSIKDTTLNGSITAGATTITLTSGTGFSSAGNGNVDGDLTGVSGISFDHADGVAVQEGEFAHVLREICADLAASYYLEDESLFQTTGPEGSLRGTALRERGEMNLKRLAHLGSVD